MAMKYDYALNLSYIRGVFMNRVLTGTICLLCGFLLGTVLTYSVLQHVGKDRASTTVIETDETASDQIALLTLSAEVVQDLKAKDFDALSALIHPDYNLLFSPYATINLSTSRCLSAKELQAFGEDQTTYVWGTYSGTNELINMTTMDYYDRFIFDADYTKASVIAANTITATGNALENVNEVFPGAQFVEYHFPSGGEGTDWRTLRLVFEQYEGQWVLTAIVHSEWTA